MSMEHWIFVFNVTAPNVLIMLLGSVLKKISFIDEKFCDKATKLVFNIALPCLLFFGLATTNRDVILGHIPLALYGAVATFVSYLVLEWLAPKLIEEPRERGLFVQGGFRANSAIIGLAYCSKAYGNEGITLASIFIISTVTLFNILSVVTLTRSLSTDKNQKTKFMPIVKGIIKNPLIIGIVASLPFALLNISIPSVIVETGKSISSLALPLALICIGASMDWRSMFRRTSRTVSYACIARLIIVPACITSAALFIADFHGAALGVIFLLSSSPVATSSYIMVRAMGGDFILAANIVALTTIGSFFTTSLGLFLLRTFNLA